MRYKESDLLIKNAAHSLAKHGIVAMYGGRKGHGFWLYQSTVQDALAQVEQFDVSKDYAGKVIKNDGKRSGNECFWTFSDAMKFVSQLEQNSQKIETLDFPGEWFSHQCYSSFHLMRQVLLANWYSHKVVYAFQYF